MNPVAYLQTDRTAREYRVDHFKIGQTNRNAADIAPPLSVIDLADIGAFIEAFTVGWAVNAKKVYKIYRDEGLSMRAKRPHRYKAVQVREVTPAASRRDERWSMDFMADQLGDGRKIRVLTIVDDYTRVSMAMEVGQSMGSAAVIAVLERLGRMRRRLRRISVDNGPVFASKALDAWAYRKGVIRLRTDIRAHPAHSGDCAIGRDRG